MYGYSRNNRLIQTAFYSLFLFDHIDHSTSRPNSLLQKGRSSTPWAALGASRPSSAMSAVATRRKSAGLSMATVGAIAALKPRPPSSPRSSYLGDITNGAAGLLSGAKGAGTDVEVARLSSKILDLMSQLNARDENVRRLEGSLEIARREAANATALAATARAPAAAEPLAAEPSSARARVAAPRGGGSSASPSKNVMVRILSEALREADQATATKGEELQAARAMLAHRSRGPSPGAPSDVPAPGVVAKLQAELAEAAEERRTLRQQLQVRACSTVIVPSDSGCAARPSARLPSSPVAWPRGGDRVCAWLDDRRRFVIVSRRRRVSSASAPPSSLILSVSGRSWRSVSRRRVRLMRRAGL
jgi:hypothetical protein